MAGQATAMNAVLAAAENSEDEELGKRPHATADELAKVVYEEVQRSVEGEYESADLALGSSSQVQHGYRGEG
jgi:hypothetical protein